MNKQLIAALVSSAILFSGCSKEAVSIGIIGGSDGPTEIFITENEEGSSTAISFDGYTLLEVDGGDLSGHREPLAVVDIGFGSREYWAFTNEYGQLVRVVAKEIILQDDHAEPVTSEGRYYHDEAKVPGVESKTLDEGHVIADSLGGVSNAYNITPQNSTLNRHGDQAYMEKNIRDAGGCSDFIAIITYPNTKTQIPSHYSITYTLKGNVIHEEFDNADPDETNTALNRDVPSAGTNTAQDKPLIGIVISELDKRAEYIVICNDYDHEIDLSGWKIISVRGEQTFSFPSGFVLHGHESVKVGGYGAINEVDLVWEDDQGVWSNSQSDPAELYDNTGKLINSMAD